MHFDLSYGPVGLLGAIILALLIATGLIFAFFFFTAVKDVREEVLSEEEDGHNHAIADVEMSRHDHDGGIDLR